MPSDFEKKVWSAIDKIPAGTVLTYKELAIKIGSPNAARAVANACGKNPSPIKTPCHRVIRSDGRPGGYSAPGGTEKKIKLLKKEGINLPNKH